MILCYNKIMKLFLKLILMFCLLILPVQAQTFDILVLPAELFETRENYYYFDEVSQIIASELIKYFNNSNGKIKSPDLYEIRAKFLQNPDTKKNLSEMLAKYKSDNQTDYAILKKAGEFVECKLILLVNAVTVTNKNTLKRSIWEILNISSEFDIIYPYRTEISAVLIDSENSLIMWSGKYSFKLGTNSNTFSAKNFPQAYEEYQKIKFYVHSVIAPAVAQNIILRLFPKSVRPVSHNVQGNEADALRFERKIPEKPEQKNNENEIFTGDMIYGI